MEIQLLYKFIKFGLVGFSGLFVDFGTTYLAKEKFKLYLYLSNSLGFVLATTNNFILNRIWTFENSDPAIASQYGKYFMVSLIALILNNGIVYLIHERMKLNFYLSKLLAIMLVMFWNFGANYLYTFA